MAKILVTGGAGFIGSHTVDQLLSLEHSVRVIDDLSSGSFDNLDHCKDRIEFIRASVLDEGALDIACKDIDGIIHLAAQVSVSVAIESLSHSTQINTVGYLRVYEAARKYAVPKIVYASSAAVYGNNENLPLAEDAHPQPLSPYGMEKLSMERYSAMLAELYDNAPTTVGLRYFNVFGPRQSPTSQYSGVISKFTQAFETGAAVTIFGDGLQSRDFIYVKDVAKINCAMLFGDQTGIFNVCRNEETSLLVLASIMGEITGGKKAPNMQPPRVRDIRHSRGDAGKLQNVYTKSTTSLKNGLTEYWRSIKPL